MIMLRFCRPISSNWPNAAPAARTASSMLSKIAQLADQRRRRRALLDARAAAVRQVRHDVLGDELDFLIAKAGHSSL